MLRRFSTAAVLLSLQTMLWGQNFRGGISGMVSDQSGSIVAGAEVKSPRH